MTDIGKQSFRLIDEERQAFAIQHFISLPLAEGWVVEFKKEKKSRSLSQNAFMHVIFADVAKYLTAKGEKYAHCDGKWVKRALKNQFLGWEEVEYTDLLTGEITTKEELRHTSALDSGGGNHFITEIIAWSEGIGCQIKIPSKCEYRDLLDQMSQ